MRKLKQKITEQNELGKLAVLLDSWQPETSPTDLWTQIAAQAGGDRDRLPPQPPVAVGSSADNFDPMEEFSFPAFIAERGGANSVALLTPQQERWLARCVERGGKQAERAREILVNANLHLVTSIARKYENRGIAMEDLIQEGTLGLIHAVDKYDWRRGFRFATYATHWIRQALVRLVEGKGRVPQEPVKFIFETSTAEQAGDFLLPADDATSPTSRIFRQALRDEINAALEHLSEQEREILTLRYGLSEDHEQPMTLEQVGQQLELTREQTRQVEAEALQKLRRSEFAGRLHDPEPMQQSDESKILAELSGTLSEVVGELTALRREVMRLREELAALRRERTGVSYPTLMPYARTDDKPLPLG